MISSNIAGYTKKQLTAALVFVGWCIGNAAGPQTFITKEARRSILSVCKACNNHLTSVHSYAHVQSKA